MDPSDVLLFFGGGDSKIKFRSHRNFRLYNTTRSENMNALATKVRGDNFFPFFHIFYPPDLRPFEPKKGTGIIIMVQDSYTESLVELPNLELV